MDLLETFTNVTFIVTLLTAICAFATVLTLGFVPVLYRLFFRVSFKDFVYE